MPKILTHLLTCLLTYLRGRRGLVLFLCMGAVLLSHCVSVAEDHAPHHTLLEKRWQWESMEVFEETFVPEVVSDYWIQFEEELVYLALEINRASARYEASAGNIALTSPMSITRAAWRPDSLAPQFLNLFAQIHRYAFDKEGRLLLETADGSLRFKSIPFSKE